MYAHEYLNTSQLPNAQNRIPLKRYGKVSEISSVIELLASDGGSYITGQNIRVDGGITKSV